MLRAFAISTPLVSQHVLIKPWIFWLMALIIGLLLICLIQRFNTWLIVGRFWGRNCQRHVSCNDWKQCSSTWYIFNFAFFFIIGLLTGYRWYAGLIFIIVFKLIEWLLSYCCCRWFQGKNGNCCCEFLIAFLGFRLGVIFRNTLCWFPPSDCWELAVACASPCTATGATRCR